MRLRDLFRKEKDSIKEGKYQFKKVARPPPIKEPSRTPIVADLMPLKSHSDCMAFMLEFGNILLKPITILKCGCVGYFYTNYNMPTFKYIGVCPIHEIEEFILSHRAIYKEQVWYSE